MAKNSRRPMHMEQNLRESIYWPISGDFPRSYGGFGVTIARQSLHSIRSQFMSRWCLGT